MKRLSLPEIVGDYELNPKRGYFSIIEPIERTNLFSNPSFETNTTNVTAVNGATIVRSSETQRRGVFSLKIKPAVADTSGVYQITAQTLTTGITYAVSMDVFANGGVPLQIYASDGTSSIGIKTFTGKGYWERVSFVFSAVSAGVYHIYLRKNYSNSVAFIFTDGWQIEQCDEVSQVSPYNLTGNLISHWRLEETLAETRVDAHGSNSLAPTNNPTAAAGKINFANQFVTASGQYLSIADNASISTGDIDFTFSGWFLLDSKTAQLPLISKWNTNQFEYMLDYLNTSDRLRFFVSSNGTSGVNATASAFGSVPTSTWIFIVCWHDSVNDTINIQVNNGTINSVSHATGVRDGTAQFRLASKQDSGVVFHDGRIDSVSFWKRVLSSDERSYLYNNGNGRDYPFTVASILNNGFGFPTTYIDGDQTGYIVNELAYYWHGTPHASISTRISQTRSGGRIVGLKDIGVRVSAYVGLGFAPLTNVSIPFGLFGGAVYQRTVPQVRNFSLICSTEGKTLLEVDNNLRRLVELVRPDSVANNQPLLMRYQYADDFGNPNGEPLEIVAVYSGGLEGNVDNLNASKFPIQFSAFDPMINSEGESGALLDFAENVTDAEWVVKRNSSGAWEALPSGTNGYYIAVGLDNTLYSSSGIDIYKLPVGSSTWTLIGSVSGGLGTLRNLQIGLDGNLYINGGFTTVSGTSSPGVSRYNVSSAAWESLSSALTGTVYKIAFDASYMYVVGNFSAISGVTVNCVARRAIASGTWSKLGTNGVNAGADVNDIEIGLDGNVYITGAFAQVNSVSTARIAKWTVSTEIWSAMSTGLDSEGRVIINGIDGSLYIFGIFTSAGGVTATGAARWNGTAFYPLGSGIVGTPNDAVVLANGELHLVGSLTSAGGTTTLSGYAIWNGSVWTPANISLPAAAQTILYNSSTGDLYVGYNAPVGDVVTSDETTVTNIGNAKTYPDVVINGSGILWQIVNSTTGKGIYFNNLTLLSNEQLTITTRPGYANVSSNVRGNMQGFISPVYALSSFFLLPGDNVITALMTSAGASAQIALRWRNTHWTTSAGIRH